MADPFVCTRTRDKFLHLSSSSKVDEYGEYDTTTSEQLHSPASSLSSRISRSPVPGGLSAVRPSSHRPSSRSPLPNGARSPRERGRSPRQPANKETELKQKIQVLEGTVAEYERQKFTVMGTFAEYRERVSERERKLEAEYSSKIITLSEEVLAAKKDFEERMRQFQALQEKFEREKEGALEKLREEHQKEIQLLEQRCSEHQLLNLEQKYLYEIQRLDEERKSLKLEKEKLTEAFEAKLWRARTLYDTELNAAKSLYTNELDALKEHEAALREELIARQEEFKDRLEEMQVHLQRSKQELARCEKEVAELEKRLDEKEIEVQAISKQLEDAKRETADGLKKLNGVEKELETTKQKFQEQEEQLLRKADLLSALENTKNNLESVIQDLQAELKSLRSKVSFLENERQNLESQSQTQQQLQNSQLQALEMVLDNLSKEKQMMKEHYDQQLEQERVAADERELGLKKGYTTKLNDFERHHKILQQQLESDSTKHREAMAKHLQTEYENKVKTLQEQTERLQKELESSKAKYLAYLPTDVKEMQQKMDAMEEKYRITCENWAEETKASNLLKDEVLILREKVTICDFEKQHKEEIEKLKTKIEQEIRESMRLVPEKKKEEYEKEINNLKSELALHGRSDKVTMKELEKSRWTVKTLQDTIDTMRSKLLQYEDGEGKRKASSKTDTENKLLRQELASTKSEMVQNVDQHTQRIKELQRKIDEQKNELDRKEQRFREEIEKRVKQKCNQEVGNNKLQRKCNELQEELEKKEKEYEAKVQEVSKDKEEKNEQLEELNGQLKMLNAKLESTKTDLEKKTQEILHIRSETHEYIRKREQQQSKTHKREVEKLKGEHKSAIKEHEQAQEKIRKESDELREKLKQLESAEKQPVTEQVQALQKQLTENEANMKKLEEEKEALRLALEAAKENQSQISSPMGSMDSLKKRDSVSSISSTKEASNVGRKIRNTTVFNKWHCLVEQVKNEHKRTSTGQKSTSTLSIHKQRHFTHGAMELGATSGETEKSDQRKSPNQDQPSQIDTTISGEGDDRSQAIEEDTRPGRATERSSNTLKLPDGRRPAGKSPRGSPTPKSPSRSPLPKHKHSTSGRKPAWRL